MIRKWERKPANWNVDMYDKLSGITTVVRHVYPGAEDDTTYRYNLKGWHWDWRHCDLILISLPEPNPNSAFRIKKHGN